VSGTESALYQREDLDLLVNIARQAAQAIANAKLYQQSQRQVAELELVNELGKALNSSLDLDSVLDYIITTGSSILEAKTGSVMLYDKESGALKIVAHKGLEDSVVRKVAFRPGQGIAGAVAASLKAELIADVTRDPRYVSMGEQRLAYSMICAPIVHKERLVGVINFERPIAFGKPFALEDLALLSTLAGQAAMAIENAALYRNLIQVHFETIQSLAAALDAKDAYTLGHSRRVSRDAVRLAQRLSLPPRKIETIRHAALLHDIGKIGVKDAVLLKPGPLDAEEARHIQRHPALGAAILQSVEHFKEIAQIVRHHHERFDGTGYPGRLTGADIPLGSRIVTITDAFDAMITTRPYRAGMPVEEAVRELVRHKGTQFDAQLVDVFVDLIKEHHPAMADAIDRATRDARTTRRAS
jgi:putative nucleotidyltransferase with HDIG domain